LAEAPEHFFNQEDWKELVRSCGGRDAALERISRKPEGFVQCWVEQAAAQLRDAAGELARKELRIAPLVCRILLEFLGRLASGELIATGFQPPFARIEVPADLWPLLWLNFERGTAEGARYLFQRILVRVGGETRRQTAVEWLEAWIHERRDQNGAEPKKILSHAAHEKFGSEFRVRAFDEAYRRVYRRSHGRPRKSTK
jgi:hypothetical protein